MRPSVPAICALLTAVVPLAAAPTEVSPPTTLAVAGWDLAPAAFESLSMDVTVDRDLPSSIRLQVAPLGSGTLGGSEFYGSLQTQVFTRTIADAERRWVGPGALFSQLGPSRPDAIRAADGGLVELTPESTGVRRAFAWGKGRYTFELLRLDRQDPGGAPCTWVGAFVRAPREAPRFIGALCFPGDPPVLGPRLAAFVGLYGPERPERVPPFTVTFHAPVVNGVPGAARPTATVPPDAAALARAEAGADAVVVRVGAAAQARR